MLRENKWGSFPKTTAATAKGQQSRPSRAEDTALPERLLENFSLEIEALNQKSKYSQARLYTSTTVGLWNAHFQL